jgi:hypothetical protein
MFAGHIGAGMLIARTEPRLNVGGFILAALLLDVVLWLLVLLGAESVSIPADFGQTHQPLFSFPYSHGLLAGLAWSALAGCGVGLAGSRLGSAKWRAGALVAAAVFSHWLLDALVHAPELPLLGSHSAKLGLGLWQNMPAALAVEAGVVLAGLCAFLPGSALPQGRKLWLAGLVLLLLAFTVAGMTLAPAPPSGAAMAASSLLTIGVACALFGWLGRGARR